VWQANDGTPRASFEVTARTVQFLGGRNGGGERPDFEPKEEESIPF
jgi:single-stranded DNA-binding protein